ncbi:hypothetical protein [Sulfurimonas sp.]|uniref:hypothetical protein n=1 Tax=Sulfurimonas sp. TaxID=2022749 RepID=UPI00263108E0|nr:hypothetical protein [Sulfurimonas sp.]
MNKSARSKVLNFGLIGLSSVMLITGCGNKPLPRKVSHLEYKPEAALFAPYSVSDKEFKKSIYNTPQNLSVRLNDLSPTGFNTSVRNLKMDGILWGTPSDPKTSFEVVECKRKGTDVFLKNVIYAPFVLGLNIILGGGLCEYHHVFDYEEFDDSVNEWLEDENIHPKVLIDGYATLLQESKNGSATLAQFSNETNDKLNEMLSKYKTIYSNYKIPQEQAVYKDESGFYKHENLKSLVDVQANKFSQKSVNYKKEYQTNVDRNFPCEADQECLDKFQGATSEIATDVQKRLTEAQKENKKVFSDYKNLLQKTISTYSISKDSSEHSVEKKHKILYYTLFKAPDTIKSRIQKFPTTYKITSASFTEIYPAYKNEDENIKIAFNPETKNITLENKTKNFIEIQSVSVYYGSEIYTINNDKNTNFVNELSPDAVNTMSLWRDIPLADYKRITTKDTNGKKLSFGFAVKYKTIQQNQQHTLYRLDSHNLTRILKTF